MLQLQYRNLLILTLLILGLLVLCVVTITFITDSYSGSHEDPYPYYKSVRLEDILPDITDNQIQDASIDNLPLHLVRYYMRPPTHKSVLCWMECLSLLSMMTFLRPLHIYVHTNYPDFWPFDPCNDLITNWTTVKLVHNRRQYHSNGRRFNPTDHFIAHEADIIKWITLYKYGGISLDFDVFVLPNITALLNLLRTHECVLTRENVRYAPTALNSGVVACNKNSLYIADILRRYRQDYRWKDWTYNSGSVPWELHNNSDYYRRTVYVDQEISRNDANSVYNFTMDHWDAEERFSWKSFAAYHAFFHNCSLNEESLNKSSTSLAELMRFVLRNGRNSDIV